MKFSTELKPLLVDGQPVGYILLQSIIGSHLYKLDTPESDVDTKTVYIAAPDKFFTRTAPDQINIDKDNVAWEIGKFLDLLYKNNTDPLEMLNAPADKILYVHESMQFLFAHKDRFLTQKAVVSFFGKAYEQIKKARSTDRMMNWNQQEMKRLEPMDFCYVILDHRRDHFERDSSNKIKQGVMPLRKFMELHGFIENLLLVNKLNHSKEAHQLYISDVPTKGIQSENGNDIRYAETHIDAIPFATFLYNGDAYSLHCKKYNQYLDWLEKRSLVRFKTNQDSGQAIDTKNMMHYARLSQMAKEIIYGKGVVVERSPGQRDYLLSIKRGEVDLAGLIEERDKMTQEIGGRAESSGLPVDFDKKILTDFEYSLRRQFYG